MTIESENDVQATIAQAIQSARYNEAVVVTVNGADDASSSPSQPREIVLVACLDPINGGVVWKDAALATAADDVTAGTTDDDIGASISTNNHAMEDTTADKTRSVLYREDPGIVRHLRTKRWALPMLNDHRRNRLYDMAVHKACRRMAKRRSDEYNNKNNNNGESNGGDVDEDTATNADNKTMRILDIGSGTGLLAMMGARHALDAVHERKPSGEESSVAEPIGIKNKHIEVQVTSVEMASAMARLARMTIDENGLSKNVKVVELHSTDLDFHVDDARFTSPAVASVDNVSEGNDTKVYCNEKADICTSELLESGLLGEGVLPSIRDAWTRHLKSDAIVVPSRARVMAVLVEGRPLVDADACSEVHDDNTTEGGGEETLTVDEINAATSFIGPELHTFRQASGGVWLSTNIPAAPDRGVLLGSQHCGNGKDEGTVIGGITVPLHANAMLDENYQDKSILNNVRRGIRPLSNPTVVLDFDFASGLDALPPPGGRCVSKTVVPTADGTCHGVLFWWELDFWGGEGHGDGDDDDDCTYSTEPIGFVKRAPKDYVFKDGSSSDGGTESNWQDHWQQCLFLFGDGCRSSSVQNDNLEEGSSLRKLTEGVPVEITSSHDDSSLSFSLETLTSLTDNNMHANGDQREEECDLRPSQRRKLNENNEPCVQLEQSMLNRHITSTRALQLNDSSRIRTLRAAIHHCIEVKGREAPLLDLSDMGLCAIIASMAEGATNVTSLESCAGSLPTLAATIAQIGNGLPRAGTEFRIIQALAEHIRVDHIAGCEGGASAGAEIVVAEPYYEMLEGWHLQEALNYFYLVRSFKSRGVISPSALSVPAYAKVMACVVEFDEFSSAYGRVGDVNDGDLVRGFRHGAANHYGDRYDAHDVSLPLWQYRYKRLSEKFCVAKLSYEVAVPKIDADGCSVEFVSEGLAQCVVFWIEYGCRTMNATSGEEESLDIISNASSSHRQIIRKLRESIAITEADVKEGSTFSCKASFGDDRYGIEDHSFTFEFFRQ